MKKTIYLVAGAVVVIFIVCLRVLISEADDVVINDVSPQDSIEKTIPLEVIESNQVSERYSAQVDRVKVVFEHTNYASYRLQTNDLVRTGDLNTERGYKDDLDATVYVLNWQLPEGGQMQYVRLTAEPEYLYSLDSAGEVIRGSRLTREEE